MVKQIPVKRVDKTLTVEEYWQHRLPPAEEKEAPFQQPVEGGHTRFRSQRDFTKKFDPVRILLAS